MPLSPRCTRKGCSGRRARHPPASVKSPPTRPRAVHARPPRRARAVPPRAEPSRGTERLDAPTLRRRALPWPPARRLALPLGIPASQQQRTRERARPRRRASPRPPSVDQRPCPPACRRSCARPWRPRAAPRVSARSHAAPLPRRSQPQWSGHRRERIGVARGRPLCRWFHPSVRRTRSSPGRAAVQTRARARSMQRGAAPRSCRAASSG
mmetsp:Transcript_3721/g.15037  ORF Transcript_3721/g.15037 Transcript_3721/m.15037 type:complete len:210 (+) Transcript_3721:949-1578(+)